MGMLSHREEERMSSPLTFPAFSTALLSGESREELEALLEAYCTEYNPRSITEERAISEMVDAEWRIRRLRTSQITKSTLTPWEFRRFESHLTQLYDRALRNLLQRKRARWDEQAPARSSVMTTDQSAMDMRGAPN